MLGTHAHLAPGSHPARAWPEARGPGSSCTAARGPPVHKGSETHINGQQRALDMLHPDDLEVN